MKTVKSKGSYATEGEASRAANAVLGTIKSWLSPSAADKMRNLLSGDASRLWQYSPVPAGMGHSHLRGRSLRIVQFVLKVQELGRYGSSKEARRAVCSVIAALSGTMSDEPARFMGQMLPPEIISACGDAVIRRAA